jgi:hypothetical protein
VDVLNCLMPRSPFLSSSPDERMIPLTRVTVRLVF